MKIVIFPYARKMRNGEVHPKVYPYWEQLVARLQELGHTIVQVGVEGETRLVDEVRFNLPLDELEVLIRGCDMFIGIDSFGQHFCWSLGVRGIVLFGQSDPVIFGHPENINLLKDRKYLRDKQFWLWEQAVANDDAWVDVDVVIDVLKKNFG